MKTVTNHALRSWLILLLALIFGVVSLAAAHEKTPVSGTKRGAVLAKKDEGIFLAESDAAMMTMMKGMSITPSGNVDRDFVALMIPHHQGAIDMAESELRFTRSEQLLRIAQEIVIEQLQEISAMRIAIGDKVSPSEARLAASDPGFAVQITLSLATRSGTSARSLAAEAPFLAENNAAMTKMMSDMSVRPTDNVDRDFVKMMVPHHQGAIDMAQIELHYGRDEQLRRIAQEIIVDQMQEIALMRIAIGEALPASVAAPTDPSRNNLYQSHVTR